MPDLPGFRLATWDTPLRVNPNRTAGRFNRENSPATQYIALHPLTSWAEYIRANALTSRADVADHRLRTWAIRVIVSEIAEIRFDNAPDYGLEPYDLINDDWTACQDLADRLREDAVAPKALQVPSAALPGTQNVVILGERVDIPYLWTPIDDGDLPACIVAEEGRPPAQLLELVRHHGQAHAEFEAWAAGEGFKFSDLHTERTAND